VLCALAATMVVTTPALAGDKLPRKRDTRIYNSRIQVTESTANRLLKCQYKDSKEIEFEQDYKLPGPFNNLVPQDPVTGAQLVGVRLHYDNNGDKFDVSRTYVFELSSQFNQKKYIVDAYGGERHGGSCDNEFYPTDSSVVANKNTLTFHSTVFGSAKKCALGVNICTVEDYITSQASLSFTAQDYDQCQTSHRDPQLFDVKSGVSVPYTQNKSGHCAGIDASQMPIVFALTDPFGSGGIAEKLLFKFDSHNLPDVSAKSLGDYSVMRLDNLGIKVCPIGITTNAVSKTNAQIIYMEGLKNVDQQVACTLYPEAKRSIMVLAEAVAPTNNITIEQGDSWWKISKRLWGDGRLYSFLQIANGKAGSLHPGQVIKVPRIDAAFLDTHTIQEGDSLWKVAIRLHGNPKGFRSLGTDIQPKIDDPDRIYPFSVVKPN